MNDYLKPQVGKIFTDKNGRKWKLRSTSDGGPGLTYPHDETTCKHDGAMLYSDPPKCAKCGKVMRAER